MSLGDLNQNALVNLSEYEMAVQPTDRLAYDDLRPVLMGLFGEVGSIMAPAKKLHREKEAFLKGYVSAVEEEFGDALWYLAALARRMNIDLHTLFLELVKSGSYTSTVAASSLVSGPVVHINSKAVQGELDDSLIALGKSAAALLVLTSEKARAGELLREFMACYLHAMQIAKVSFSAVLLRNVSKTTGRFLKTPQDLLPTFDMDFNEDERLPDTFEIVIKKRTSGLVHMQWNGVYLGDPLSDNILDQDGYRYHDVFHFAHAAVLHWSPTFRSLTKRKRKSNKAIDEAQDGGRAIVVEEGLTAWLFSHAKHLELFENQSGVSFDLLKTIEQFVSGYEVAACPLKLWEDAILQGYSAFRKLKENEGGIITCSRTDRKIAYAPL